MYGKETEGKWDQGGESESETTGSNGGRACSGRRRAGLLRLTLGLGSGGSRLYNHGYFESGPLTSYA